jgi:hypothetical protein
MPEYRDIFIKVIEKHQDIEENIYKLKCDNKNYKKYNDRMREDNEKLIKVSSKDKFYMTKSQNKLSARSFSP